MSWIRILLLKAEIRIQAPKHGLCKRMLVSAGAGREAGEGGAGAGHCRGEAAPKRERSLRTTEAQSGERETVFRRRVLIDLTQGDDPVITEIMEPVTPLVPAEEPPADIPYTLESPEYLQYIQEHHVVIRNSCA